MTFKSIQRTLQQIRCDSVLRSPTTVNEIFATYADPTIFEEYGKSKHDKKNIFFKTAYHCAQFSYCVFASESIISTINASIPVENRRYLMDATFKIVPDGIFKQILIIYVEHLEKVCEKKIFILYNFLRVPSAKMSIVQTIYLSPLAICLVFVYFLLLYYRNISASHPIYFCVW